MAPETPAGSNVSVVPFGRLVPDALDPLFEAQRREWLDRLSWDLTTTSGLVATAIRDRSLRGAAVFVGGEAAGFAFYSVEPDRSLVGDFYVLPHRRTGAVNSALAEGIVRQIQRSRPRKRVENQAICFDTSGADEVFARHGFARYEREYRAAASAGATAAEARHESVDVRGWRDADFAGAARAIFESYRGTVDARVNGQYRSPEGCADLLEVLTSTAWCGRFDPAVTRVAVDRATGRCCGVVVASVISRSAAHLGQISVLPRYQGRGVGRALVRSALGAAEGAGLARVTLAVTLANARAARLYELAGFHPVLRFSVYTREPARLTSFR